MIFFLLQAGINLEIIVTLLLKKKLHSKKLISFVRGMYCSRNTQLTQVHPNTHVLLTHLIFMGRKLYVGWGKLILAFPIHRLKKYITILKIAI